MIRRVFILNPITIFIASVIIYGCSEKHNRGDYEPSPATLYLSVRAAAYSINEDDVYWEDRVDELRMLIFDSGDGSVVYNDKLYFPNGFADRSRTVTIDPGTYDFYFIANETVYSGDFVTALMEIENKSDFATDTRFLNLDYNPDFIPDGTTNSGRFLMSAIYDNITVASGGTEENPLPLPIPTAKVELVRSLAKVEVIFRKKISGSTIPDNTITSVRLANVASHFSVPPLDDYYTGSTEYSNYASLDGLDYTNDSLGSVVFYIPEFLVAENGTTYTELQINNNTFPIESDSGKAGLAEQRRDISSLSDYSVIRNYHYIVNAYINAEGGVQIWIYVEPWQKDTYIFIFQGDKQIVIPPIYPTDSSIVIPTECGKIEIHSTNEQLTQGLQGAYNDVVNYWDAEIQGPTIIRGDPPYYCEKKYDEGWRLINSCELLSFLAYCDVAYNIWTSNTWLAAGYDMPYYPLPFRQEAQYLLEKLTGEDLSSTILYDEHNNEDLLSDEKINLIDRYFTPGDIMLRVEDFPNGWPFESPPGTDASETWYYNEVTIQVKAYWYGPSEYITLADRSNWDLVLYHEFRRYDYSSTVSRCVREVD
ncbi:MAG: FimB/Mfa2 family fimbrial subunit [Rikenellaceae bacterium]|nr:FimB/Mfa2 family fimbrial subunit [Rikenellaceae bacterium]